MTDHQPPAGERRVADPAHVPAHDVIDDKSSDVLAEEEVVHVPPGAEELAESQEPGSTFLPDVPDWDEPT